MVMETAWSTMWNVTDETPVNCQVMSPYLAARPKMGMFFDVLLFFTAEVFRRGWDEAFPGLQGGVLQSGVASEEHDGTVGQRCRSSETPVQAHDHTFRQGVHQAPHLQAGRN